jgi:hypothetical protein
MGGAAPASAATRPVVVYEPAVTGPHPVKSVVRPSSWYLTIGPATEFRGAHWSNWGSKTAAGTATMYVIDFGTHNEGHARLKLYDVKKHGGSGSGDGIGAGEPPVVQVEIPSGQGIQVGDGGVQADKFIHTYIAQLVIQAPVALVAGPVVAGNVPAASPDFQPRAELLAVLRDSGPAVAVVRAVTGMRGVGKTQVAAAYARACINVDRQRQME